MHHQVHVMVHYLLCCLTFTGFTGSYVLFLGLTRPGHTLINCSNITDMCPEAVGLCLVKSERCSSAGFCFRHFRHNGPASVVSVNPSVEIIKYDFEVLDWYFS